MNSRLSAVRVLVPPYNILRCGSGSKARRRPARDDLASLATARNVRPLWERSNTMIVLQGRMPTVKHFEKASNDLLEANPLQRVSKIF